MTDNAAFIAEHGQEIERARTRISSRIRRTPALRTDIDERLVLKAENLQVTGAFKVRGALNAVMLLREREPGVKAVCTVSSGNHAQAVAYAARVCGLQAVVVIPQGASQVKVEATRALGAEVISDGVTFDNREEFADNLAAERGIPMVHPFDDWDVIHGQGTTGLELLEDVPDLEAIAAPIGGGGMLTGVALAVRHRGSTAKIVGVEPETADDAARSFSAGVLQRLPGAPSTLADGVRVRAIGERNFEVLVRRRMAGAIVTVSESELRAALTEIWRVGRLFVEPTAALPLAAYRAGKIPAGARGSVALVLTGGNIDPSLARQILETS